MDLHQNARLTFRSREALAKKVIVEKVTLNAAAAAFNVSARTARKWVGRYRDQGRDGLWDRSSRPRRSPLRTRSEVADQVLLLRRQRWTGIRIAQQTGLSRATVSRILRRHKLSRMRDLEPAPPLLARIAKPGHRLTGDPRHETRGAGWEILHVAIDDHSRIGFTQMLVDERAESTVLPLRRRRLLPPLRHHRPPRAHRQCPLLLLAPVRP